MNTYIKKPVQIQAMQFKYSTEDIKQLQEFCPVIFGFHKARHPEAIGGATIKTLEDGPRGQVNHYVVEGDYVIKGVRGEFYACKPDIFKETYELVV